MTPDSPRNSTEVSVLFLGESGVGKGMFARALHRMSARAGGPLVSVNCAAIPDALVEAELFGVDKGAYTGATASRAGRFERASGGTLFLDEVGSLSFTAQGKLLRALQERVIERVGGSAEIAVDTRVVAATNTHLAEAVRRGRFREDLYYRLNVFPIDIPPLRQRREDIPLLMDCFLERSRKRLGKDIAGYTEDAVDALCAYAWPGNIREMENMIERACILASEGEALEPWHLFSGGEPLPEAILRPDAAGMLAQRSGDSAVPAPAGEPETPPAGAAPDPLDALLGQGLSLEALNRELMARALAQAGGNLSAAARLLGMTRDQFDYRWRRRRAGPSRPR